MTDLKSIAIIDDTHAIRLLGDPDADNPLDWPGDALESTVTGHARSIDPAAWTRHDRTDPLIDAITAHNEGDALETALERHYERRGWTSTVIDLEGPSQSDWIRLVVATDPKRYCPAEPFARGELTSWWRGDVYRIELLKAVTWTSDDGRVRTEWEPIDSIGGVYLDQQEDWTETARRMLDIRPAA
ncbi:hypothetical protein Uis1B_2209 [Bifidobacterium margollesii]|uniref:Uncharacterized protein n=1 Tax=Bifidobacterium margollesii TaxID=2020964 RepID=A0A2N5J6U5_9BIFI|nr:hypothetical protein [Bifidobacterium margollesii]PLS29941.1 hypothetical protein Uis1B_2209 [Bifidobacterium margollesii]